MECSTSSLIFDKFDFLTNKHPTKGTILYQWFKSNLGKSYEVTSSKFLHFDISHVTIPKRGLENVQFNIPKLDLSANKRLSLCLPLSLYIYIYRQIDLTKAKVLNIQVFYNNNLFEN